MGRRSDWTDDQLRAAVKGSSSWRAVAAALGLARGSTHRVKRRADELLLDTTHFSGNRRWDPAALRESVTHAASWDELAALLGTERSDVGRIRGAARRYGVETRHLDAILQLDQPDLPAPQTSRLSMAAEALATAWFLMAGSRVSIPATPSPFDLLVSDRNGHRRVQVKTTTHRDRDGRWAVVVAHRPYRLEARGGREPYDHDDVDDFLIINGAGEFFLIPISVIAGRISIVLDHYRVYCVGTIGDLFHDPGSHRINQESDTDIQQVDLTPADQPATAQAG